MTFAGEQPRCRVETDPTGARQKDLGPGVQIGKVLFRPRGTIERFDVRRELDQIAGNKSRRESQMTQKLHSSQPESRQEPEPLSGFPPATEPPAPCGSDNRCHSASCD